MQIPIYLGAGILFQIPNLEFGINLGTGVGVLLEEIPDLQFVVNLGDFSSASGLKPRVSEILAEIANLQIPPNLGDFSNIADDDARQEGRAAGVRAAGWAGTAYSDGMGTGGKGGHDN